MKIGFAAANTPQWPKIDWWVQSAQREGHDVRRSTTAADLPPLLAECDLVVAAQRSLAGRWPNVRHAVAERKCPLAYLWFDLVAIQPGVPLCRQPDVQNFRNMFLESDYVFVKERDLVPEYRELGIRAHYLDQGCPDDYPSVVWRTYRWDLLLWGQSNPYYRQRLSGAKAVADAGYKVAWIGGRNVPKPIESLPEVPPGDLWEFASQARCVLSVGRRNDVAGYVSDAFWLALGMGACVIRRSTPGLPDGPYLIYHTDDELLDAVSFVTKHEDDAKDLGRMARQWVMENHTISERFRQLIRIATTAKAADSCW